MGGGPTLMFCIGAAKAGTSWLHRYLAGHPACHFRGPKELHYFDAVEFGEWDRWIDAAARHRDCKQQPRGDGPGAAARRAQAARDAADWLAVLEARRADDAAYLAYLREGCGDARVIGDVTPAYGLLPEHRLRRMAGLMPDVRFVYLLRDPVARIWSHVRMMAARAGAGDVAARSARIVSGILNGHEPAIVRRSDYIGPVTRLRAAVAPTRLFFGFYEELFAKRAVAPVCGFLGIEPRPADFDRRVMPGPAAELAPAQWEALRNFLAPQYDAMRDMLGRLPEAWGRRTMRV